MHVLREVEACRHVKCALTGFSEVSFGAVSRLEDELMNWGGLIGCLKSWKRAVGRA